MTEAAQQITTIEPDAPAVSSAPAPITPMGMVQQAIATGAGMEVVEKLMALHERWEANQGRKAFDAAIAEAKGELPTISKNRTVDYTSSKGRTHYRHEDLAGIAEAINPVLAKHGLSYRFRTAQAEGGMVTVTCVLSHRDGYSEETSLSAGRDDTGNKNNHQAVASAVTYLQRYTLKAALGLAAAADDDGQAAEVSETLTAEQTKELSDLLTETGGDLAGFLKLGRVERLQDIRAADFEAARNMIITAGKKRAEKAAADKGSDS